MSLIHLRPKLPHELERYAPWMVLALLCSCSTPSLKYEPKATRINPLAIPQTSPGVMKPVLPDQPETVAGERLSEADAQGIALHALGLVGTVYRYGGNTPDSGFDCSGLIHYVIALQTPLKPPRTVAQLKTWGIEVPVASRRTGDLIFFGEGPEPTHAGIYVGQGRFVHAPSSGGTVHLSHLDQAYWARLKVSYRRP
jgi:cell wall-associated NlpC family hydrolase